MAGDEKNRTKECKYCMTVISRRARVCPQCGNSQSSLAGIRSLFRNAAWLVTAGVSLAFAGLEKAENLGLNKDLEAAGITIASKEVQTEVLREAIAQVGTPRRSAMAMRVAAPDEYSTTDSAFYPEVDGAEPQPPADPKDQIEEIDKQIADVLAKSPIDRKQLKELERRKLEVELGL
jgi:hypothetical protein